MATRPDRIDLKHDGNHMSKRIVHVSTHDFWGGAAIAAYRLHCGLQAIGQDSTMFVANCTREGQRVLTFTPPMDFNSRLGRTWRRKSLARELDRYGKEGLDAGELFSDDRSQHGRDPLRQIPPCDVLHLHLIAGFLDLRSLFDWLPHQIPVVWTLHDLNPFTGGCHFDAGCRRYRGECGTCPKLGGREENDLSRQIWNRKQTAYNRMPAERLQLVAPCRWVADEARHSFLLGRFPVTVIPYGVDVEAFAPRERAFARDALGIPREAKVLVFAALNVSERRKGFSLLIEALSGLRDDPNLFLLVVGGHSAVQGVGIPCRSLGYVTSDRLLSIVFSAADLCVVPTLQETGPLIVIESLACGTPVVGFPAGDMPDMVRSGLTGLLVPSGDSAALRDGIRRLLACPQTLGKMRVACRQVAVGEYSIDIFARRYLNLYESILEKPRGGSTDNSERNFTAELGRPEVNT
jgi:glycosyltransferase involved in cell wall biosynthesis